eukprot:scaffold84800_cov66-Phaeocystis_antarctica.AAC.3
MYAKYRLLIAPGWSRSRRWYWAMPFLVTLRLPRISALMISALTWSGFGFGFGLGQKPGPGAGPGLWLRLRLGPGPGPGPGSGPGQVRVR